MNRAERLDPEVARTLLQIAENLGGNSLTRAVATSLALDEIDETVVVVTGFVKRGKSTLVNQIIGEDLSPTGPLPETASLIAYRRADKRKAVALDTEFRSRRLPSGTTRFRSSTSRRRASRIIMASYEGDLDVPDGIALVDTAGVSESLGAELSIDTSGTTDALLDGADLAIVVLGAPPGPSGAEIRHLLRVTESLGWGRVLLVIKALDSSVDAAQLQEWKEYLSETAGIPGVLDSAVLLTDRDPEAVQEIRNWLDQVRITRDRNVGSALAAYRLLDSAIERSETSLVINISDDRMSILDKSFIARIRPFTPTGILELKQKAAEREYLLAHAQFEERKRLWDLEHEPVRAALTSLLNDQARYVAEHRSAAHDLKGEKVRIGCLGALALPMSMVAFPVGPLIVGGLLWILFSVRAGGEDARLMDLRARATKLEPEIANLKRQSEILERRRPIPPVKPTNLIPTPTSRPKWKRPVQLVGALLVTAGALSAGAVWLLPESLEPPATSSTSVSVPSDDRGGTAQTSPRIKAPVLDGLTVGTRDSGLSSAEVRGIQDLLSLTCCPSITIDGFWGPQTQQSVETLRTDLGLGPVGGIDEEVWGALLDRTMPMRTSGSTRPTAVNGVLVPAEMVLMNENALDGALLSQQFVLPYSARKRAIAWVKQGNSGEPTGGWIACPPGFESTDVHVLEWQNSDGSLLRVVAGSGELHRDEIQVTVWGPSDQPASSCAASPA